MSGYDRRPGTPPRFGPAIFVRDESPVSLSAPGWIDDEADHDLVGLAAQNGGEATASR